ncbi:NAD(P)-dependent oxidoreductase [Pseudooceanicola sp. 200-1SW]|uniref:NAD(P)-dependent oxidoreductase n=1 Tax=Pseudooceanicola sp. 200-1SW TaxID=3425949 RepID=UPI003D7F2333
MPTETTMRGVYLSDSHDLSAHYGPALAALGAEGIELLEPRAVTDPAEIRFALCWQPGPRAFAPYPNLRFAMGVGAGVDALLTHPGLPEGLPVCRVRDPDQAMQMAGFALHEVLHVERRFEQMAANARNGVWQELPLRRPGDVQVAVLGGGSMGRAVARAIAALGFDVRVAVRRAPDDPLPGVRYLHGDDSLPRAAEGAEFLINVLPLTSATRDVLDRALLARMAPGGWLVQIGRGEHLVEADLLALLAEGHLAGATLDVLRDEPLPRDHPLWQHPALRITPHVASAATDRAVARQLLQSAREARDGLPLTYAVDRAAGY